MTETPPNESSSSPTESAAAADAGSGIASKVAKGCGCLIASTVLVVGVALVGKGDMASWGSGIIGVLFLILVVGSSGLTGFWNKP
jgi:hypothetical protein